MKTTVPKTAGKNAVAMKTAAKSPKGKAGKKALAVGPPRRPVVAQRPGKARPVVRKKGKAAADANVASARLLGAETVDLSRYDDPRVPLMNWLRSKNNRFLRGPL